MHGNFKYPTDDDELLVLIRPEMHRLTALDASALSQMFGLRWTELVEKANKVAER